MARSYQRLHSPALSPATFTDYSLADRNYEHVAADIAETVTIPSPLKITLTLDTLITR